MNRAAAILCALLAVAIVWRLAFLRRRSASLSGLTDGPAPAVANNNPLNLTASSWRGAVGKNGILVVFATKEDGIRAAFEQLKRYVNGQKSGSACYPAPLDTIEKITGTWAPSAECGGHASNNPAAYARFVSQRVGIAQRDRVGEADLPGILAAMARMEQGFEAVSRQELEKALSL